MRAGVFCLIVSVFGLAIAGTAQAQTYRWVEAGAPPADVVRAPGSRAWPVCQIHAQYRHLLGGFHDGRCHADLAGNEYSDAHAQFLVVVSGPAGGKWAVMGFREGYYWLPNDFVFGAPLNTDLYGEKTLVCANAGVPGLSSYYDGSRGESGHPAEGCAREPTEVANETWALIGRLQ